jgi:predicted RNase H-like nuclease (RuvC/YqgF family)
VIAIVTSYWKYITLALVIALAWFYVTDYIDRGKQISDLKAEARQYTRVIATLRANADQARDELRAAQDLRKAFVADAEKVCKVWNKIEGSDNPVDDVLEELKKLDAERGKP